MTEEEGDLLFEIREQYWRDFSKLVANALNKAPRKLHDELLMQLQEASSVYGSNFSEYLSKELK